jgi:hypothetical protein
VMPWQPRSRVEGAHLHHFIELDPFEMRKEAQGDVAFLIGMPCVGSCPLFH